MNLPIAQEHPPQKKKKKKIKLLQTTQMFAQWFLNPTGDQPLSNTTTPLGTLFSGTTKKWLVCIVVYPHDF
jgi:hypothetical protein